MTTTILKVIFELARLWVLLIVRDLNTGFRALGQRAGNLFAKKPLSLGDLQDEVFDWSFYEYGDESVLGPEGPLRSLLRYAGFSRQALQHNVRSLAALYIFLCDAMWRANGCYDFENMDVEALVTLTETYVQSRDESRRTPGQMLELYTKHVLTCSHGIDTIMHFINLTISVTAVLADSEFTPDEILKVAFAMVQDGKAASDQSNTLLSPRASESVLDTLNERRAA